MSNNQNSKVVQQIHPAYNTSINATGKYPNGISNLQTERDVAMKLSQKNNNQTNNHQSQQQSLNQHSPFTQPQQPQQQSQQPSFNQYQSQLVQLQPIPPSVGSASPSFRSNPITNEEIYEQVINQGKMINQIFALLSRIENYLQNNCGRVGVGADQNQHRSSNPPPPPKLNLYIVDTSPTFINEMRFSELHSCLQKTLQLNIKILKENESVAENSLILFPVRFISIRSPSGEFVATGTEKFQKNAPIIAVSLQVADKEKWGDFIPEKPAFCSDNLQLGLSPSYGIYFPEEGLITNSVALQAIKNNHAVIKKLKNEN